MSHTLNNTKKSYVIAILTENWSYAMQEELSDFLGTSNDSFVHAGMYNEYVFYNVDLDDNELLYARLRFGPEAMFVESKNESMGDLIIRVFNAGAQPRFPIGFLNRDS